MYKPHFILLSFSAILLLTPLSQAASNSIVSWPQPASPSFKINSTTQTHKNGESSCTFTVTITTSCSSPLLTGDQVSLTFGDAYGNQVYAPRIDDPSMRTFERCSSDTYQILGSCTYQICYLYVYRSGQDGWIPNDITVYGYNSKVVSFHYNEPIPADIWYGFDYCSRSDGAKAKFMLGWSLLSLLVTILYTIGGLFGQD